MHFNSQGDSIGNTRIYVDSLAVYNGSNFWVDDILLLENGHYLGVGECWNPNVIPQMAWVFSTGPVPLSVKDIPQKSSTLRLWPNPAGNHITLSAGNSQRKIKRIRIYNIQGQLLMARAVGPYNTSFKVDISSLSRGMYLLQAEGDEGFRATVKFVVDK